MDRFFSRRRFSRRVQPGPPSVHPSTPPRPGPPKSINKLDKRPPAPAPKPAPRWPIWLVAGGLVLGALLLFHPGFKSSATRNFSYSGFVSEVTANKVSTATISSTGLVTGKLDNGAAYSSQIPTALSNSALSPLLLKHKVQVTGTSSGGYSAASLIFALWPLLLLVGVFFWFARRGRKQIGGIMSFGRSKAKLYDEERPSTRFADIAGYEGSKAEVMEVVDYLKHPGRYASAGAVGPKGVLMVGPPGTGKTLLARAVAGEAGVPFFALSGSSFVEMFVGVGASRVRSLFEDARKHAPSIIFIDEIDAIGGRAVPGGSAQRRTQADPQPAAIRYGWIRAGGQRRGDGSDQPGGDPRYGPAAARPLRPDGGNSPARPEGADGDPGHPRAGQRNSGQTWILTRCRAAPPGSRCRSRQPRQRSRDQRRPGSARCPVRRRLRRGAGPPAIGRRDGSNALLPEEKRSVAVHEAGHALVAVLSEHADPVAKVTILPRGAALGVTEQLPESERHLYPQSYLTDTLAVRLGGRAAEIIVLGEPSTGAADDLAGATGIATRMVREWGFSTEVGPIGDGPEGPSRDNPFAGRPYAEETQRSIDREMAKLLREAESRATTLLRTNLGTLGRVVDLLLERETIDDRIWLRSSEYRNVTPSPRWSGPPMRWR